MPRLRGTIGFGAVLLVLAAVFPASSAVAAVLHLVLPRRVGAPLGRGLIRHGFRFIIALMRASGICRFDLSALAGLRQARGVVIVANHPSLLDVVLVVAHVPDVVCITKASLWDNPLVGGTARLAGYIRNDAPLALVRRAVAELQAGSNLLIFPEGTRTMPGTTPGPAPPGPFKPGFALMAKAAGAPVQAVLIQAQTPFLGKGWPVWRKPPLPMSFRARLGARTFVTGPTREFVTTLEDRMRLELPQ